MEEDKIIQIENLRKDYKMFRSKKARLLEAMFPFYQNHDNFSAINNLNLDIYKGEVLGILGKNGAGKSTLLKMITGVVIQTTGMLKVNGKISSLLELGAAFNPELTGEENIYQHGQVMGLTKKEIENTKQDIIDFADIGDHLYQPVKTYSSGMFARLAFACAINVDPDILIVDEVLSVGDMAFQLKCFKKFQQFKEKQKTILYVTHNVADVLENCTRTIILNEGNKIYDGEVKEGVEKYKKLITGMLDVQKNEKKEEEDITGTWKSNFNINPEMITYGTGEIKIIDFGIFDENDEPEPIVSSNKISKIKIKAEFYEDVECPTFSITIKNFLGKEICGTNTNFLKVYTGKCKKHDKYVYEFSQKLMLAPGKYTLSVSCSKFDFNGNLIPINRNYDALIFEVISDKSIVGYYDIDSRVSINKIEE